MGKGFLPALLNFGITPNLIILRREPRDVAKSMFGYNAIPDRTVDGMLHFLGPSDRDVIPLDHWTMLHDYQLCFWYCIEMERRQRQVARWMEQIGKPVVEVHISELCDPERFYALAETLNISAGVDKTTAIMRQKEVCSANRNPKKKFRKIDFDIEPLESNVLELITARDPLLWQEIQGWYLSFRESKK